jgi:nucleoside-diphosphate-sugar epimerase
MKVAIVGYGWLGLPLGKSLKQDGFDVIGTSTSPSKVDRLNGDGLITIQFSGESNIQFTQELADCDWIVLTVPPSGGTDYVSVLKEIIESAPSDCKVVFTSSIGVYQEVNGRVDEQSAINVDHPVAKAEYYLRNKLKNRLSILRLGGLIGGDRHPIKYLAGKIDLEGGENPVNLIQLEDVINAIKTIINDSVEGQLFNLVFPEHPTKNMYYNMMAEKMSLRPPKFLLGERNGKLVMGELISLQTKFNYSNPII